MDNKDNLTRIVTNALAGVSLSVLVCGCGITTAPDKTGYPGVVPIWQHRVYQPPSDNLLKDMAKNPLKYDSSIR